jgi:hypothetical protein
MGWAFLWLMLALKIPIGMLLYLVWWAARQTDETEDQGNGDGGTKTPPQHPHPSPRRPRRGPHGDPAVPSPPRVRVTHLRGRRVPHR